MAMKQHGRDISTAARGVKLGHAAFAFIAAALREAKPEPHCDANKMAQWVVTVNLFADRCRSTNVAFKRDRFLAACGVDG